MRVDGRALGYAVATELVLAALVPFGGVHGELGALPWVAQLPGILLFLFLPTPPVPIAARVAAMLVIQLAIWYAVYALVRRARRRGAAEGAR